MKSLTYTKKNQVERRMAFWWCEISQNAQLACILGLEVSDALDAPIKFYKTNSSAYLELRLEHHPLDFQYPQFSLELNGHGSEKLSAQPLRQNSYQY